MTQAIESIDSMMGAQRAGFVDAALEASRAVLAQTKPQYEQALKDLARLPSFKMPRNESLLKSIKYYPPDDVRQLRLLVDETRDLRKTLEHQNEALESHRTALITVTGILSSMLAEQKLTTSWTIKIGAISGALVLATFVVALLSFLWSVRFL